MFIYKQNNPNCEIQSIVVTLIITVDGKMNVCDECHHCIWMDGWKVSLVRSVGGRIGLLYVSVAFRNCNLFLSKCLFMK